MRPTGETARGETQGLPAGEAVGLAPVTREGGEREGRDAWRRGDEPLAHLPTENAIYGRYNGTLSQNGRRTVRPFEGTARCSKLKRQRSEPLVAKASGLEASLHW